MNRIYLSDQTNVQRPLRRSVASIAAFAVPVAELRTVHNIVPAKEKSTQGKNKLPQLPTIHHTTTPHKITQQSLPFTTPHSANTHSRLESSLSIVPTAKVVVAAVIGGIVVDVVIVITGFFQVLHALLRLALGEECGGVECMRV